MIFLKTGKVRFKHDIQGMLVATVCCALLVAGFTPQANGAGARETLKRTRNAAEFADHIEDGIQVSRTVNRAKDIAEGDIDLEDRAKNRLNRKTPRVDITDGIDGEGIVDGFVDNVEREIAQEVVGNQARKAVRKAVSF